MLLSSLIGGAGGGGSYPFAKILGVNGTHFIEFVVDPSGGNNTSWITTSNNKLAFQSGVYLLKVSCHPFRAGNPVVQKMVNFSFNRHNPFLSVLKQNNYASGISASPLLFETVFYANNINTFDFTQTGLSSGGTNYPTLFEQEDINIFIYRINDLNPFGSKFMTSSGNFTVPSGVSSVSVMLVGRGEASVGQAETIGGGCLYSNNIPVSPGDIFDVTISGYASVKRGVQELRATNNTSYIRTLHTSTIGSASSLQPVEGRPCGVLPGNGLWFIAGDSGGGGTSLYSGQNGTRGAEGFGVYGGTGLYGGGARRSGLGPGAAAVRFIWGPNTSFPNNATNFLPEF